jgi:glucan 1,3-beta-glucosidase
VLFFSVSRAAHPSFILASYLHIPVNMSHQQQGTGAGHGVAYDPVPDLQEELDTPLDDAPYDPYLQHMSAPPVDDDLNPDEPSINLVRPRFLGTIDGEGIRESLASVSSRPQSENVPSLYALNPGSLSTRGSQTLQPDPAADSFSAPYRDDPRSPSEDVFDGPSVPMESFSQPRFLKEKQALYASPTSKSRRRNVIVLAALGGVILLIVVIVVPVYFLAIKPHSNKSSSSSQSSHSTAASPSSTSSPSTPKSAAVTGGDGSTVTMDDGTTFTYSNPFGGYWYYNPKDPLNNSARAQSWTPALNETFNFGADTIHGCVVLLSTHPRRD